MKNLTESGEVDTSLFTERERWIWDMATNAAKSPESSELEELRKFKDRVPEGIYSAWEKVHDLEEENKQLKTKLSESSVWPGVEELKTFALEFWWWVEKNNFRIMTRDQLSTHGDINTFDKVWQIHELMEEWLQSRTAVKAVARSFVCGYKKEPGRCVAGNEDCNNYCNHDHSKPMADCPKTYETIEYSEKDIWIDVIEDIAGWLPSDKYQTIYEFLLEKYSIKFNQINKI